MLIYIHMISALIGVLLGGYVLWNPKGTNKHKILGRYWVASMLVTSLSSFGIRTINPGQFSLIHFLSVFTLFSLISGYLAIRKGHVDRHRSAMRGAYLGLVIAGIFAAMPGRIFGDMLLDFSGQALRYIFGS